MPVKPGSRFAGLPVLQVQAPDGSMRLVVGLRLERLPSDEELGEHKVTQGEEIDSLARRYLGDEGLWWRLLDANPLMFPLDLKPGDVIKIPWPGPATRVTRARRF